MRPVKDGMCAAVKIATKPRRHKGTPRGLLLKKNLSLGVPSIGGKGFMVSGRRRAVMTNCHETGRAASRIPRVLKMERNNDKYS